MKTAISPLAREIRSSIDFFERQNDLHVSQIYAGAPRFAAILQDWRAVGHMWC